MLKNLMILIRVVLIKIVFAAKRSLIINMQLLIPKINTLNTLVVEIENENENENISLL